WHFSSMAVAVHIGWERRIGMFPTHFDADGLMYTNTSFGDYPHYAPHVRGKMGAFTGWMLLSYHKPVKASSSLPGFGPEHGADENIKTVWVAERNDSSQWLEIDLQQPATIYAVQVNYNDYKTDFFGKPEGLHHRYVVEASMDGRNWQTVVDRKNNYKDVPNDYVELDVPTRARYVRYRNVHVPTANLSISGLRVFGTGEGKKPSAVCRLSAKRGSDRREVKLTWDRREGVHGYNVRWGIAPDKLYSSWLVYGENELEINGLNIDQPYFFTVEAFNENGVSEPTAVTGTE